MTTPRNFPAAGPLRSVFIAASLALLVSCGKPSEVVVETSGCGNAFIADDGGRGHYLFVSKSRDALVFSKTPSQGETEKAVSEHLEGKASPGGNFRGARPLSGALDLCYIRDGKCATLLENFVSFDPLRARGLMESSPEALASGDQNLGKIGLLLPLYKAGVSNPDWAVFNPGDRRLHTLGGPGMPASIVPEKLICDGTAPLYRGERQSAKISPSWPVVATLSREGRMVLFTWPEGKLLHEASGVFSFCFHPMLKTIYFGSGQGVSALAWEKQGREKVKRLSGVPARMIRVSSRGSYLFTMATGGRPRPAIIALTQAGNYRDEPLELGKRYGEAADWVWLDDRRLMLIFDKPSANYWELDVRKGEYYETALGSEPGDVRVVAANTSPSVARSEKDARGAAREGRIEWLEPVSVKFEPLEGVPSESRIVSDFGR